MKRKLNCNENEILENMKKSLKLEDLIIAEVKGKGALKCLGKLVKISKNQIITGGMCSSMTSMERSYTK